jgi:RNA polymerase sigma-54 factor
MRQSLELLAMPAKELSEYIESILEKNPFLKKQFDKKGPAGRLPEMTGDVQIRAKENPRETLISQIRMLDLDDENLRIAEYLIYEMDANGYITKDLDAAAEELGTEPDELENVLEIIQRMDPPGIGARNTKECLQLQLRRMNKEGSTEYAIVTDFINELAINDIGKIADALNIKQEEAARAAGAVKKLNPRPASSILAEKIETVIPDLIAHVKSAKVTIGINHSYLPELTLYNPYKNEADIIKEPEAREFIKNNEQAARHLIDNLKRREDTVCKVASYLLNFQLASLKNKKHDIKSLAINDVAKALGFHPSTISRSLANKYVRIGDEVIALSGLLSGGIAKEGGGIISKTAVKKRLSELIKNERKERPLSDDEIKEALKKEGVLIERRTVAKYRTALRILPKHLRKKVKSV